MTVTARAVAEQRTRYRGSDIAKSMYYDLRALEPSVRREFYRSLSADDMTAVWEAAEVADGTVYALWQDDPIGYVEDVLHETTWSKQREVLRSLTTHKRVAVPSAFGTGKTHIAARAALWRASVFPPGTSLTVTTATRFRQVQRQLWPHIGQCAAKAGLLTRDGGPLEVDQTQMHAIDRHGTRVPVAYGFSAPPHDEAAVQGIHAPRLFIVVDEAGGISRTIGKAMRGLLTGSDTRMLAIGNPPTDDEGSWFEELCNKDAKVKTIRISAFDAPLQSGERTRRCRACPPEVPAHALGTHLVDQDWIEEALADHGPDAPFVKAKVHALFPKGGPSRAIPSDWVDLAVESPEPEGEGYVNLADLVDDERDLMVAAGAWVRLGVDVAAGGGDEMVVSRLIGDVATIEHTSSGATNSNSVEVAGKVLEHIRRAEKVRKALATNARVRVKIDGIGVGWGVASTLKAWGDEGVHDAEIVAVIVSEDTYRDDEGATLRPYRKRDEMWLATRSLLQPRRDTGRGLLRFRFFGDTRTAAQLSAPTYGTNSGGRTVIESKDKMKARGIGSPDRAEALLLAVYEPKLEKDDKGVFEVVV